MKLTEVVTPRRWLGVGLQVLLVLAIVALVAGQLLGQPILLGFVETGSMEDTLSPGDGFVAIPSALAGEPEPGDVVVFDAQELEGGGLTTHRVVGETEHGYETRGDANPFDDQDGAEPYVQDGQIVATALQVNGEVVRIPRLGVAATAISDAFEGVQRWLATTLGTGALLGSSGLAYVLLGLSVIAYAVETIRERRSRSHESRFGSESEPIDPRVLCGIFAAIVVIAAVAAMAAPAGTESFDVVSASFDSDRPLVIESGTTEELTYAVPNGGLVPVVSYVVPASDGVAVDGSPAHVDGRDEVNVTVELTAPEETGYYPMYTTEYRYLHVLPAPTIEALFSIHPWLPYAAILGLLGGGTYALGRLLIGTDSARERRQRARRRRVGSDTRRS